MNAPPLSEGLCERRSLCSLSTSILPELKSYLAARFNCVRLNLEILISMPFRKSNAHGASSAANTLMPRVARPIRPTLPLSGFVNLGTTMCPSELKVKAKCVVEMCHEVHGHLADYVAKAGDGDRANLLGLRLGLDPESGLVGR